MLELDLAKILEQAFIVVVIDNISIRKESIKIIVERVPQANVPVSVKYHNLQDDKIQCIEILVNHNGLDRVLQINQEHQLWTRGQND